MVSARENPRARQLCTNAPKTPGPEQGESVVLSVGVALFYAVVLLCGLLIISQGGEGGDTLQARAEPPASLVQEAGRPRAAASAGPSSFRGTNGSINRSRQPASTGHPSSFHGTNGSINRTAGARSAGESRQPASTGPFSFRTNGSSAGEGRQPGRAIGRPVVFVHVPKAGGTTVQDLLLQSALERLVPINHLVWSQPSFGWGDKNGLWFGHRRFDDPGHHARAAHPGAHARGPVFITTLRDTVSATISLHDFLLSEKAAGDPASAPYRSLFFPDGRSLDEFLDVIRGAVAFGPGGWPALEPGAGTGRFRAPLEALVVNFSGLVDKSVQYLCGFDKECQGSCLQPELHAKRVGIALRNLDRIHVVAVTEGMNDILPQLQCWLPWFNQTMRTLPRINAVHRGNRSRISAKNEAFLRRFSQGCMYDAVYARAASLSRKKALQARACARSRKG